MFKMTMICFDRFPPPDFAAFKQLFSLKTY